MAKFIHNEELSAKIRHVLSGSDLCCGVAFIGKGTKELLDGCDQAISDVRMVCDISLGGTRPTELTKLGAPSNSNLRHCDRFHAKVYISSNGVVVGSANMSDNGIGFWGEDPSGLTEAGIYYESSDSEVKEVQNWFDILYTNAHHIDRSALNRAARTWGNRNKELHFSRSSARQGSLLDMVRLNPEVFGLTGFVFVQSSLDKEQVRIAKKQTSSRYEDLTDQISGWPETNIFIFHNEDIVKLPTTFFEFWMPRDKLSVFAHTTSIVDYKTGNVFSRRSWKTLSGFITDDIPNSEEISLADAETVQAILKDKEQVFSNAMQLQSYLLELEET